LLSAAAISGRTSSLVGPKGPVEFRDDSLYTQVVPLYPVSDSKALALRNRLTALGCFEQDIKESFTRGHGVDLYHVVSGIRIRCCQKTSQGLNRFLARRLLADELEARIQNKTRCEVKAEKIRAAKHRRKDYSLADRLQRQVFGPNSV
jgi:hypothetical protein